MSSVAMPPSRRWPALLVVLAAVACASTDPVAPRTPRKHGDQAGSGGNSTPASLVRVTSGAITPADIAWSRVSSPVFRAFVEGSSGDAIELEFEYDGPTATREPLASGEVREQIGVKLRARDTCNVVYVMWHHGDSPALEASVKHNPGSTQHSECGDRGYTVLRPDHVAHELPRLRAGERHSLRAEIHGDRLVAFIDGKEAWSGRLPQSQADFRGPAGIRSDNMAHQFAVRAPLEPSETRR
jgi:hypothetical protein